MDGLAAVLWDMDGTLIDSEKLWDIPLYEVAEHFGGTLTPEGRALTVGTTTTTTVRMIFEDIGLEWTAEREAEAKAFIYRRIKEIFAGEHEWRPGAEKALRMVRESGLPTALVTSTERELAEFALNTIGREHFDVTITGDDVDGNYKPHPEPYLRAARLLGVDPTRAVAVEDSPTGTASAVAAGCTVLVVPCDAPVEPGERRVFRESLVGLDLADLAALVADQG
ncbi:HAD family hydrolase [Herbihabitans rhizosphaerae]